MGLIKYSAHCQDIGWLNPVDDNQVAGTVGQNRKLECFEITELNIPNSNVDAHAHVSGLGWNAGNGIRQHVGSTGQNRAIEAIYIGLTGDAYNQYDIWYRCHVQDLGWLDWSSNGEINGTVGGGKQVEAIQITIHSKNEYYDPRVNTDTQFIDLTPHKTEAPVATPTNKAQELIDKAMSWVGYCPADPMNSVFGAGDYCCHFVRECCQDVGIYFPDPDEVGSCPNIQYWADDNGKWTNTPQPGDVVLFDFNSNGTADHIGIVKQVYGLFDIDTIEGNTGTPNGVHVCVRQNYILGYIRLI